MKSKKQVWKEGLADNCATLTKFKNVLPENLTKMLHGLDNICKI